MKRFIIIILLCAVVLCCFASCDNADKVQDIPEANNKFEGNPIKEVSSDERYSELISTLVQYLNQYWAEFDLPPPPTLAENIDKIKLGTQALLVSFDPSNYYYICGYYNADHEYDEELFCCANKYTWVKLDDPTKIPEAYEGKSLVVAFQINKSKLISDIVSEQTEVPDIEYFQIFDVEFENGYNTKNHIVFEKTIIYLNEYKKDVIFYSEHRSGYEFLTIRALELDGEFYIPVETYVSYHEGEVYSEDLSYEFGKYHDDLMEIMIKEKYSETPTNAHYTRHYGVLGVRELVDEIIK